MLRIHAIDSNATPCRAPRCAVRLLGAVFLAGVSIAGVAAESAPDARDHASVAQAQLLVQDTTARVLAAMSRDLAAIKAEPARAFGIVESIVMPNIDLERTSRMVLGRHWSKATEAQRARFMRVFGDQLVRTYVLGISDYLAVSDKLAVAIDYLPGSISEDKRNALIRTRVGTGAMAVSIDYRLHRVKQSWRVFDVLVEGVSVASTYRSSFTSEANRNGMDGLIERIDEKNRRLGPA